MRGLPVSNPYVALSGYLSPGLPIQMSGQQKAQRAAELLELHGLAPSAPAQKRSNQPQMFRSGLTGHRSILGHPNQSAEAISIQRAAKKVALALIA